MSAFQAESEGRWEDVVHPSQELRERIAEVVNREIRKEIIKNLKLPRNRELESMTCFRADQKDSKHRRDCNGRSVWSTIKGSL